MMKHYIPNAIQTTSMKTKIIVSDDQPVYQQQRHLAPKEKIALINKLKIILRKI